MTKSIRTRATRLRRIAGFTLIEFMAAMGIFMVVGGAAFMLFRQDVPLFNQQQNLAGLNIGIQNAVTQIQQDVVNAGAGYYASIGLLSWPVGITIVNTTSSTGSPCQGSNYTYNSTCFDTLNVITSDPAVTAQHVGHSAAAPTTCVNTNTTSSLILYYSPVLSTAAANTLAQSFTSGDEVLLVSQNGQAMTTLKLNAAGSAAAGVVTLSFNSTTSTGGNTVANDPLSITTNTNTNLDNGYTLLSDSFCNSDWLLRLRPTTYSVDTTSLGSPSNPKLVRTQSINNVVTTNVVCEQIIGFRVGASLWNDASNTDVQKYNYTASTFGTGGYDFSLIRSIRVSLIGRTPLGATGLYNYQNSFDGGPYEILGASIVVNPRNLSMGSN
jgi:Tfp pilus assembly protein PilW